MWRRKITNTSNHRRYLISHYLLYLIVKRWC